MDAQMSTALKVWNARTAELAPGVQRAFIDALTLASEGKIELVFGADYDGAKPCLVNAVAQMLQSSGGQGIPSRHYGPVVSMFDSINHGFASRGINLTPNRVSETAALTLLRNFGDLKPMPTEADVAAIQDDQDVYVEPSDDDLMMGWIKALDANEVCEEPLTTTEYARNVLGQPTDV